MVPVGTIGKILMVSSFHMVTSIAKILITDYHLDTRDKLYNAFWSFRTSQSSKSVVFSDRWQLSQSCQWPAQNSILSKDTVLIFVTQCFRIIVLFAWIQVLKIDRETCDLQFSADLHVLKKNTYSHISTVETLEFQLSTQNSSNQ